MMFPTNPFPQVFPPSNSILDHEKDDLYTYPFLSGDCFPANENFTTSKQDLVEELGLEQCDEYNHLFWKELKNKKPSKKDHHSKIHTAQGPRDRRVRLSIEVAKKFFYLQDLLEFDKASNTLDWLFSKSKIAIDELIKRKKQSLSSTSTDRSEVLFLETGSDEQAKALKKKCGEEKRKKITRKYKSGFIVNQSRAEARARARERTKEKLNSKKIDDKILTLYSYQHNPAVSDDSSSKFTTFSRFTDLHEPPGDYATI